MSRRGQRDDATGVTGAFQGRIGRTWRESQPWLEPVRQPARGAPNVLFVVLDDVGFAQLGCYGSDISTPHIDALTAGGRRYRNFHTTSMCSPRCCARSATAPSRSASGT